MHKGRVEDMFSLLTERFTLLNPLQVDRVHMGPEDPSNRNKLPIIFFKANFRKLQDNSKYVSLKIGSSVPQKLGPFFHFS